jgi:hypothetical protein
VSNDVDAYFPQEINNMTCMQLTARAADQTLGVNYNFIAKGIKPTLADVKIKTTGNARVTVTLYDTTFASVGSSSGNTGADVTSVQVAFGDGTYTNNSEFKVRAEGFFVGALPGSAYLYGCKIFYA